MRITVLFLCTFFMHLSSYGQSDTTVIPIGANWQTGDHYDFKVTKIKRTWNEGKLTRNDSSQYLASFRVLHSDSVSYTIKWSFRNIFFDVFGLPEYSRAVFPNYENVDVIYRTNHFGVFMGIENWQEIRTMIHDLIQELINTKSSNPSMDVAQLKKSMEPVLAVYSTQRGIEQLVLEELLIFHFPYGKQYTWGKLYSYGEKIPVMVNTIPVTGNGVIFIRSSDTVKHTCEIVQRMKVLPDSAYKMLNVYFRNIGMKPEAIGSAIRSSVLEISENNIFNYFTIPGIPEKLSAKRETKIDILEDKMRQIDETFIERIGN